MAVGALASVLIVCAPACAQDTNVLSREIKQRIESTFALVLNNAEELAIPLTRRALARRLESDNVLAYQEPSPADDAPAYTATISRAASVEPAEEGSAEDAEDSDIARLPRPRPAAPGDEPQAPAVASAPAVEEAMGGPLDLVAGAAEELVVASVETPASIATSDPQPLLVAHPSTTDPAAMPVGPELVATGACLSPSNVTDADGDFNRNADVLSGNGFCIAEETFKERKRTWTIATIKTSRPGPLFAVMHDDEDLSFDNAVEALKTYGGTLVAVETGGKRNLDGIDPNRNFSADGIGCRKLGNDATPEFTGFFRRLFDPGQPIIAFHNNTGKRVPTGGLGHVAMSDIPKGMNVHEAMDANGELAGERTLVLLTSAVPVTATSEARAEDLSAKGINAIVEKVEKGKGDCSLSNYTLLTGFPDYLNITVDDDEGGKQEKIVDIILSGRPQEVATQ